MQPSRTLFGYFKLLLILTAGVMFLWLIYVFVFLKPTNFRNWEVGTEILPQINISNNQVSISNVRDYRYAPGEIVSFGLINRTIDISQINKVWYVVEPFTQFKQVAHTYFVFDITDQDPIVVSVEARREKGESFSALEGIFNKYELIYIWGTEKDETIRRVIVENNKLYMYPLKISNNGAQQLFLQLAESTHQLEEHPRFYNTFTSNCTNELAKSANKVKPGAIPFDIAWIFPGYSAELLYKLGYLPNNLPLDDLTTKYYISDKVRQIYTSEDFSKQLRLQL